MMRAGAKERQCAALTQLIRQIIVLASLLWLHAHAACAFAAVVPPVEYAVRHWTSGDGLPANRIQCLLQTRDGYLWIGTANGLVRFNGVEFQTHLGINCRGLAEDEQGVLWIATTGGLFRCSGEECIRVEHPPAPGAFGAYIFALARKRSGGVWATDSGGLLRVENSKCLRVPFAGLPSSSVVHEDRSGRIWFAGSYSAPLCWDPAKAKLQGPGELPGMTSSHVFAIAEDASGFLWFGAGAGKICCWKDGIVETLSSPEPSPIHSFCAGEDGAMWVGTSHGLWQVSQGKFVRAPSLAAVAAEEIHCLLQDRENNLWMGTQNGLFCAEPKAVSTLTTRDGLVHDAVWSITQARDGSMWIGTHRGLTHLDGEHSTNYSTKHGLRSARVHAVTEDAAGRIWVGTESEAIAIPGALYLLETNRFLRFDQPGQCPSEDISGLLPGLDGTLWITGGAGLTRWRNHQFYTFGERDGIPNRRNVPFLERSGALWAGGYCLYQWREGKDSKSFGPADGMISAANGVLHEDEQGALWISSSGQGLFRYKAGKFTPIGTQHGLFSNLILSLLEDDFGRYWFGTHQGIFSARKQDLNDVADGKRVSLPCLSYGIDDGMLSAEGNGGNTPNACKTRDGRLWFPTTKGVAIIDPKQIREHEKAPAMVIEEVLADGETVYSNMPGTAELKTAVLQTNFWSGGSSHRTSEIHLPPGHGNSVVFHYAANVFAGAPKVRFRYRLEGRDQSWNDVGPQRFVQLSHLRPGRYVFHVTASNARGVWNTEGIRMPLVLQPHLYQTWTFYLGCAAFVLVAIGSLQAYRLRVQRKILLLEQQAALAQERERIARDMHDDLGASLTKIKLLSELAGNALTPPHERKDHIQKISATIQDVARSMDEIVWTVNPRNDTLDRLVDYITHYTEEHLRLARVRCRFDVPTSLPALPLTSETRHNLFLVVKEAINNIVKHARASEVHLRLRLEDHELRIVIEDDGQGFDPGALPRHGNGLTNMRGRIASLGGRCEFANRPGPGTTVTFTVPLPRAANALD